MHSWHVSSPGLGTTEPSLSLEPLATEGEATPGPDDYNPFDEAERRAERREFDREPGLPEFAGFDPELPPPLDDGPHF